MPRPSTSSPDRGPSTGLTTGARENSLAQQDRELDPPETLTRQPTTFSLPGAGKERAGLTRRVLKAGRGTIIAAVVFLALIQVASLFFPPYIFPGLPLIAQALVEVLTDEADHILRTVARFGI